MRYKISIPVSVFLIALTILLITAFQVCWLSNNYREEKKMFTRRTNILLGETIFQLQAARLKRDGNIRGHVQNRQQERDSFYHQHRVVKSAPAVRVYHFLVSADSLRDVIPINEITDRYRVVLKREKINTDVIVSTIPADTSGSAFISFPDEPEGSIITVGFTRPLRYQLTFEHLTCYLFWHMRQPILFSAFLLSIAVFSFSLLYRNMKALQKQAQLKNDFINTRMLELKTQITTVSVTMEALKSFDAQEDPQIANDYLDIFAQEMQQLELMADKVLRLSIFEAAENYPGKSVICADFSNYLKP